MNTTGPHGSPLSWSTIRSTEETALQEICWLLLSYCRYSRYTVDVISLYILQSWVDSQSVLGLSFHKCCLNTTDADHSFSFPPTCILILDLFLWFPISFFHNHLSHLSAVLFHGNFNRFLMMMRRSGGLLLLSMTLLYLRSRCNKQNNSFLSWIRLCFPFLCKWLHPLCYCCALAIFLFYKTW